MPTQWDRMKAVQRMQDHVEAHLGEPITMAALARAACYSPYHAARVFKEVTGKAPFEYVRARRLTAAARRLLETPCRVIDVALDFDFDSHEGFTRAFARQFGVPPRRFRRSGSRVEPFLPPQARDWYSRRQRGEASMTRNEITTVFVQVLDRPARRMIVKRARKATHYFEYCEEVGCEVWGQLAAVEDALQEPLGMWLPEKLRPQGTSEYVQGVEVPAGWSGKVPDGFEIVDLPACRMMVFQGPPFEDQDFEQAITSLWDVMKSYRPETYGFAWADDDGPRFQLEPVGYRGYIEGRPVRAVS